ncbi:MAG: hypothetical protein FE78DRAFT_494808 [Acidomyces sp. 'richmondensis']|nr:MAG: hypothetical protein FE78DRAFT_494808 [Acidomyces sp. 'richmondensis']
MRLTLMRWTEERGQHWPKPWHNHGSIAHGPRQAPADEPVSACGSTPRYVHAPWAAPSGMYDHDGVVLPRLGHPLFQVRTRQARCGQHGHARAHAHKHTHTVTQSHTHTHTHTLTHTHTHSHTLTL